MSDYSRAEVDAMIDRDRTINRQNLYELDFEIEYQSPIEQIRNEMQRETRTFKGDNTFVVKPIFKLSLMDWLRSIQPPKYLRYFFYIIYSFYRNYKSERTNAHISATIFLAIFT